MSSKKIAISVKNIRKNYLIYDKPQDRLKQYILPRIGRLFGKKKTYFREFKALKDISFDVYQGDAIAIVGRNGSGKSTLLQLIAGTLSPSAGQIEVNGRIAALLELGSGFNIEFTGRENVYHYASVLGIQAAEIDSRIDEILDFAAIGDFIDQPVKTYSSGMLVRLAFSVSACIEPDILIVDEALAVGDAFFQIKCLERLKSLIENGTTLLFVSHDMGMVKAFCDRAIYLENGAIKTQGTANLVAEHYFLDIRNEQRLSAKGKPIFKKPAINGNGLAFGTEQGQITEVQFISTQSQQDSFFRGETAEIQISVKYSDNIVTPALSLIVTDNRSIEISGKYFNLPKNKGWTHEIVKLKIPVQLTQGTYHITTRLEDRSNPSTPIPIDKQVACASFEVIEKQKDFFGLIDIGIETI